MTTTAVAGGRIEDRDNPPGVSVRMGAVDMNLALVAAVASGAAEALDLDLEPSISLRTIAVEAAGNVISHAYPDDAPGPLEVSISERDVNGGDEHIRQVRVSVTDEGVGCGLPPSASDPPGLGLSIICSLADAITLRSGLSGGTSLDATIEPDRADERRDERPRPATPERCDLAFGDQAFLRPILARVVAAQVDTQGLSVDDLGRAVRAGDAIAATLETDPAATPPVSLSSAEDPPMVSLTIGPLAGGAGGAKLVRRLRDALSEESPDAAVALEPIEGGDVALVTLPLDQHRLDA